MAEGSEAGQEESAEQKVRFLEPLDFGLKGELSPTEGALTMPCFPLGPGTYVPHTEQTLNIFEPRYRKMYSDILLSGGRRFVVPQMVQDEQGLRLAEVGVVFYLDDLKDVSEQTKDQVKYICKHKVISRVRLKRVLNPVAFQDRSTYLKVEVEDVVDTDLDETHTALEEGVVSEIAEVASLQERAGVRIRFNEQRHRLQNATRTGLWTLVEIWQNYIGQRFRHLQSQFQEEVKARIVKYLKEQPGEIPSQVSLKELPEPLQREVLSLNSRFQEEAMPLMHAQNVPVQELVQAESHRERLAIFQALVVDERRRLEAKLALKSVFPDDD